MPSSVPPSSGVIRDRRTPNHIESRRQKKHRHFQGKQPPNNQSKHSQLPLLRLLIVWAVLVFGSLGVAVNLYQLQVVRSPVLLGKARQQQMVHLRPLIPRRPVVDRNNATLAIDRPLYTLYAHPRLFKKSQAAIANQLAPILNRSSTELIKQFNTRNSGIKIASALPEETAAKITPLRLDGIDLMQQYSRLYPHQSLMADVVGYVDYERRGQAGVEYSQEKWLERSVKTLQLQRTAKGTLISANLPQGFLQSDDLRLKLTLDHRLQRATQYSLKQQLQKFNAKRGCAIVMDVRTGAILALVTAPSYDPNEYYKSDVSLFKNWALSDLYEPGSTFKPINVAIALENGVIQPSDVFSDPEVIKVGGWPIRNFEPDDRVSLSVAQILQYSSNVGMVQIMQKIQPTQYYNWLKRLGLGQKTGVDLPFEAPSQIKSQKQFVTYPIEPATASFGQGFSLTPIKLVQLHAALANGGKLVTPHVVHGIFDTKGKPHWQPTLPAPQQIFSPKTTQTVLEMMETVVTQGSGTVAQIPGYRIGGKTGTAQKAKPRGGYYSKAKITSFVSILPIDSPRYVALVVVDEPRKGVAFGSTVAAPVVKSIMESLISFERIPPSQPIEDTRTR